MQGRVGFRWSGALAIVLALHGTAAWMLLSRGVSPVMMPAAAEAVMLDLAPDLPPVQPAAVAPPALAASPPPVVEPPPPEPEPEPELAPAVEAEAVLPVPPPPPPRPQPRPKPRRVERAPAAPARPAGAYPTEAAAAAAPVRPSVPAAAPASSVTPSWRSDLLARLQRAKRYPDLARSHGDQGIAAVSFTLDRGGRVLGVTLVRSSNSALLDDEAVALVRRAEPLPSLPEEMQGSTITLTVPISFALR